MTGLCLSVRIVERWTTAYDVVALRLVPDRGALPDVAAGAHIDVEAAPGVVRQYSLTNQPGMAPDYVIGVKLEPTSRGGSKAIHERLRVGDMVRISPPRSGFPLLATRGGGLLIAGGIGVTPLLSMARSLRADQRPFALHYFARSAEHVAFRDILEPLGAMCRLHLGLDGAATAEALTSVLSLKPAGMHLYVCGPGPMLDLTLKTASDLGWPRDQVHFECFTPYKDTLPDGDESAFEVVLVRRGLSVQVPAGTSIIEALRQHNIDIPTSCEQGICGTCLTNVIEGQPDHRDHFLDEAEKARGTSVLPCVSRSLTERLVLDL